MVARQHHTTGWTTECFDYLTMSVNQHNWTSCHNIVSGMYTTGSFAYLTDKSTLIAYREDGLEREYRLGSNRFMGNSKRWRQCVYVDERTGAAIFGRQYPNTQSGTTEAIRMLYERQMSQFFRQEDRWLCSTNGRLHTYERRTEMCYHDVTHGYQYELTMPETCASIPHFSVGSIVFCPGCGTEISNTGRISCDSCNHENRRVA